MDTEKVMADLNKKFAQPLPMYYKRRVVFWLDESREYAEKLDDFALENATLVKLTGNNLFSVKKLLNHDDPYGNYVIYCPVAYEKLEDNWLLDVQLYSEEYRTDLISQWMQEMGLTDHQTMRAVLKRYRKFFNAQARRSKIAAMDEVDNPAMMHLAVMGAITGVKQPMPKAILKAVLEAGLDLNENELYQSLVDYEAKDAFCQLLAKMIGYTEVDLDLRNVAAHLLLTAATRTMKPDNLAGLERFISESHQSLCYDLVSEWLHSDDKDSLYQIARQVEVDLHLKQNRFNKLPLMDLLDTECFPCINEVILSHLMQDIANEIIDIDVITKVVQKRRTCVWYDAVSMYYDGLLQVANMQRFYLDHGAGFHDAQPEKSWKAYTEDYYRMDTYYRQFHVAYGESLKTYKENISDLFVHVSEQVEKLYVNWFMKELGENWTNVSEDDLREFGYVRGIPRQTSFYQDRVVARRSPSGRPERSKTFVVISDALRYEVASGLVDVLRREQQAKVSLDSMQGIFPTITKFGMAALLPHNELTISTDKDNVKVLVDGMSTDSNNRDKVLKAANPNSIAVRYEDIIGLKQKEVRELISGMEIIYIYHDRVDASSHGSEGDVFAACDIAIRELHGLVKKITGDMNGTHILITADHGFLYTHDPLTESGKVGKASFAGSSLEFGRRYAILKEGTEPDYLMPVCMKDLGTTFEGYAPRESIRIKMSGAGQNFVHGGTSLQEMVVPVVVYQHLRNDSKEYQRNKEKYDTKPVTVSLLSTFHQVSNMIFTLKFHQHEAVGDNWRPETYLLYFTDEAGNRISDTQKIIADKTDPDEQNRYYPVTFNLKQQKYDSMAKYYLVIQDEQGLQLPQKEEFRINIAFAMDDFNFFDE